MKNFFTSFFSNKNKMTSIIDKALNYAVVEVEEKLQELFTKPILLKNFEKYAVVINEVPLLIGNEEENAICVMFSISKILPGKLVFLISASNAKEMLKYLKDIDLQNQQLEDKPGILNKKTQEYIENIASIFSMSFLSSLSNTINKAILISVPLTSYSFKDSLINDILFSNHHSGDTILLYMTKLIVKSMEGIFFYIPETWRK